MELDISINVLIQVRIVCKPGSRGKREKVGDEYRLLLIGTFAHWYIGTSSGCLISTSSHYHIITLIGTFAHRYIGTSKAVQSAHQHITTLAHHSRHFQLPSMPSISLTIYCTIGFNESALGAALK